MQGMGKTTLLRDMHYLCTHHASPSTFDHVFFLGDGTGCTVGRVQHVLSDYLDLPPPHRVSDVHPKLAKDIYASLKQKTFLLLLDDVRERLDLEAVVLPMPLRHKQKVIFTTRNHAACAEMGRTSSNIMQMRCWDEGAAWNLFKNRVGDQVINAHPHIKPLSKKMAAECRGLPSALDALGGFMSITTDIREWRYVYGVLKTMRSSTNEIQEVDDEESFLYRLEEALNTPSFCHCKCVKRFQ
ncbi:hypothetical protein BS78_05G060500 [Paspalum vaginatum]|nr:hypothetical protein BS78_05G060500 [Paspalum vaginatum]